MRNKRYDTPPGDRDENLTPRKLEREREYGAFWYSWLWHIFRPVLMGVCVLLVVGGLVMSGVNLINKSFFDPVEKQDDTPVSFTVASGSSLNRVARDLEEQGLLHNGTVFKYYADLMGFGQKIQAGEYVLRRSMSMTEIIDVLTTGDGNPLTRVITVIPGWTVADMAEKLFTRQEDRQAFLALCRDGSAFSDFYYIADVRQQQSAAYRPYVLEGYLAADTYEVYTKATPEEIIRKLLSQTQAVFPAEYEERAQAIGLSMDEVFILASMIEKEAKTADFASVSAVFHNRLNTKASQTARGTSRALSEANGTLGSDATIKYATGSRKMSLSNQELNVNSPYNTYIYSGLPAGPICSPSKNAIIAALYPDEGMMKSGVLYFCSKDPESGELCFAATYAEHQNNVNIYRPLWEAFDRKKGNQ